MAMDDYIAALFRAAAVIVDEQIFVWYTGGRMDDAAPACAGRDIDG